MLSSLNRVQACELWWPSPMMTFLSRQPAVVARDQTANENLSSLKLTFGGGTWRL